MNSRTKIELMRIPSIEQAKLRPLLGESVQMRATYKHVRTTDYATSRKLWSNVGPGGSYLTTKSCDNIYARQIQCCAVEDAFVWRDSTRSEEQLCPPPVQNTARSRLSALLKKLSPRPLRSKSQPIPIRSPTNQLSPPEQRTNQRKASECSLNTAATVPAPKIIVAPILTTERPKRLYEPNKAAKLRSNRCYSGKSKVALRPHTLHLPPGGAREHQRRMASYESIGSCSLDVDITTSASELVGSGSVSEQTLHSLELSANEPTTPEYVKRVAKLFEPVEAGPSITEIQVNGESTKKPSYLGLACSISGYTTITNYDSKLREGFRSRDHSPGRFIRSRDVSPFKCGQDQADCANIRCSGNFLALPKYYEETLKSGGVVNRQEASAKGVTCEKSVNGAVDRTLNSKEADMADRGTLRESSRSFMSTMLTTNSFSGLESRVRSNGVQNGSAQNGGVQNGSAQNGGVQNGSAQNGGVQNGSAQNGAQKRSPGSVRVVEFTSQTKSYVHNGAYVYETSETKSQFSESKSQFLESKASTTTTEGKSQGRGGAYGGDGSSKSFIQQRVERLYGPGALAQGFFRRASGPTSHTHTREQPASENEDTSSTSTASSGLPVLRHLRPEFRAQLCLARSKVAPVTLQHQVSVESVTDVLPAAPEVVLPIEQPVADVSEVDARREVKDGAYFLRVLKDEIDVINAMVAKTERDLEEAGGQLDEEVAGRLRTVIGQARLLVKQKLQQFEGLCHKNLMQCSEEPFPTTCDDLAGFWDMVKLQVSQVHASFADLDRLKANNWREEVSATDSAVKRRPAKQRPAKVEVNPDARKAREEARRKMMEEKRRQMREKKGADQGVEIYVPEGGGN